LENKNIDNSIITAVLIIKSDSPTSQKVVRKRFLKEYEAPLTHLLRGLMI